MQFRENINNIGLSSRYSLQIQDSGSRILDCDSWIPVLDSGSVPGSGSRFSSQRAAGNLLSKQLNVENRGGENIIASDRSGGRNYDMCQFAFRP